MGHISYRQWAGPVDLAAGNLDGVEVGPAGLVLGSPTRIVSYADPHRHDGRTEFEVARWTSPVVVPGFGFSELIASWNTTTPAGSWLEVSAVVTTRDGRRPSKPYCLGRWAMGDEAIARTSVPGQGDETADVAVDVLIARAGVELTSYQVTVALHRRAGVDVTPVVTLVGVMVSELPEPPAVPARTPSTGHGVVLNVPTFSQERHLGRYPHLSNGGESWCSPTSTAMVLSYFDAGPAPADYAWVDPTYDDPCVIHAAAHTYDSVYGAGNWPFNTAYASELGMRAIVTRLHSVAEIEQLIGSGIPVVVSVSFAEHAMQGAGYSTEGHLMVVVGFTDAGEVIVNDPASHLIPSNDEVQTVYDRGQFTAAWMAGSHGVVYLIHPPQTPLPPRPEEPHW